MFRVGIGYDVHSFAPGRRLVLGGIELPGTQGLAGHSDADVIAHAIGDALLGAAGLGDLGTHFPPSDPQWKDCSSLLLLQRIGALLQQDGWQIVNIDVTFIGEQPRLAPHRQAMQERLAAALEIAPHQVSIKATTNERLGFIGRGEGAAALAVALITRPDIEQP